MTILNVFRFKELSRAFATDTVVVAGFEMTNAAVIESKEGDVGEFGNGTLAASISSSNLELRIRLLIFL